MEQNLTLDKIQPHIRYVNNYEPACSYTEKERIIYDYEFMYVMNGSAEMHYDGAVYELNKSDIFYFKPNVKNFMIVDYEKHFRTHCIHFDWLEPLPEHDFTAEEFYLHSIMSPDHYAKAEKLKHRPVPEPHGFSVSNHIKNMEYDKFASLFSRCYYAFIQNSAVSLLRLKALFMEITAELASINSSENSGGIIHPKIIYAIEYIKANYKERITAPELAERFGLSPKYFGALFKSAAGVSVSDFILNLRIGAAKEMLMGTNMSIEEISEKAGFSNAFYFSKCFKDKEKISPSGYRSVITSSGCR